MRWRLETSSETRRAAWRAALADLFEASPAADEGEILVTDVDGPAGTENARVVLGDSGVAMFDAATLLARLPSAASEPLRLVCVMLAELVRQRLALERAGQTRAELQEASLRDALTGLANRRAWDAELARLADAAGPLALAIFDLDGFKQVNDAGGHLHGDAVLAAAAARLRGALRQNDFLARIGGDEFGLLLPGVAQADAGEVLERVRRAVAGDGLSASVGWNWSAPANPAGQWPTADRALQRAKQAGGDRSIEG